MNKKNNEGGKVVPVHIKPNRLEEALKKDNTNEILAKVIRSLMNKERKN